MKFTIQKRVLIILFLAVFGLRLFFAFQTPHFSSDQAYYEYRNIDYVAHTLKPMVYDELSYSGRYVVNSHIFHYFMAFFYLLLPYSLKIVPEFLLASTVLITFIIANLITKNETAALLGAALAGFVPAFMTKTLNQISVYSVVIPLLFLSMYALLNIKKYSSLFVALSFILPLVHPTGALFSISLIFYLIFSSAESMNISRLTKEASVLAILTTIFINMVILKRAFLDNGIGAIWTSIPQELIGTYFKNVTALNLASHIGVLPLIFGVTGFAFGLFKERKQPAYLSGSLMFTVFILLALKWIDYSTGIMLLGILLSIMASLAFDNISRYISMTKFAEYKSYIMFFFVIAVVLFSVIPSVQAARKTIDSSITGSEIMAMEWLRGNTPPNSVILADIEEGHYISFFAERKNVGDTNFLMAPSNNYRDIKLIFTTPSLVKAMDMIDKYGIDYIYFSQNTREKYNTSELLYTRDESCFRKEFENEKAEIYHVIC